jgi:hypothetical protein
MIKPLVTALKGGVNGGDRRVIKPMCTKRLFRSFPTPTPYNEYMLIKMK